MSDFNWCHGPNCHTYQTVSRVRGTKGNKVLKTRKITKASQYEKKNWGQRYWHYFCNDSCMRDYLNAYAREIVSLHPRPTPLETPVNVAKETRTYQGWNGERSITETKINPIQLESEEVIVDR